MTIDHVAARTKRLEQLGLAFTREEYIIRQGDDPLLYVERQEYMAALRAVVSGAETARLVVARARQRLERRR
jgi:hypothetical protein